jgi:hypothetical protein
MQVVEEEEHSTLKVDQVAQVEEVMQEQEIMLVVIQEVLILVEEVEVLDGIKELLVQVAQA